MRVEKPALSSLMKRRENVTDNLGRFGRGAAAPSVDPDTVAKDLAFGDKGQKTAERLAQKLADGDRAIKVAAADELNKLSKNSLPQGHEFAEKNLQTITDYVKDHPFETVAGIAIASATIVGAVLGVKKLRQKLLKTADAVESSAVEDAEKLAKKALTEVEELQHFISDSNVYVMTRGFAHDYTWQGGKADGAIDKITDVPLLKLFNGTNGSLIYESSPSVAIARQKNKLCLAVTGIQTNRVDRVHRPIRASFAIEADIKHEERIRMLAAKALRGELDEAIATAGVPLKEVNLEKVYMGEELDYAISPESIKNMLSSTPKAIANEKPSKQASLRKIREATQEDLEDMQDRIAELAAELEHIKLPDRDGPLVISTGISSKKEMEKAKVWKGIADFADVKD